jgi:hypothetical protein
LISARRSLRRIRFFACGVFAMKKTSTSCKTKSGAIRSHRLEGRA